MRFSPSILIAAGAGVVIGALSMMLAFGDPADKAGGPPAGAPQTGSQGGGRRGYSPVVAMTTAAPAAVARRVDVIGQARALKSVALTSEVTGLVEMISIAPGQRVAKGDLLVQIDDDEQQVALVRARAEYPIAKDNAERYRNLESDEAASELEAEQAQTNFVTISAQLKAAQVAVAQRKIIAPFDGIVGLTDIEEGDYLRAGDQVTTLDDTSSIIIEFSAPQESAAFINIGQKVTAALTSAAATKFDGVITAIDSRVDPESRTLRAEAVVENSRGRLIPGAVLAVSTTAKGEAAIAVPGLAVQWDRSGAFVWRRGADGKAERASIVILQRTDETVMVEGDLEAGDAVVSEGADRVRAGAPLPGPKPKGADADGSVSTTARG